MGLLFKNIFLAIPFYFLWNFLAPLYFLNLPESYKNVPFWHIVGIFSLVSILRLVFLPESPGKKSFHWRKFDFNQQPNWNSSNSNPYSNIKDVTPNRSE